MMVEKIVPIFKKNGLTIWGGDWFERRIDYHHFQATNKIAILCSQGTISLAEKIWPQFLKTPERFSNLESLDDQEVYDFIRQNKINDDLIIQKFKLPVK